jgi:hypothetical protein
VTRCDPVRWAQGSLVRSAHLQAWLVGTSCYVVPVSEPRRLRLPELLRELGALDEGPNALPRDSRIEVGAIIDKADEAGFGFFFALLALIAIPFFGLSTPFGLAMALGGLQLFVGRQRPWFLRHARARQLPLSSIDRVATMLEKRTRFLERMTRRRFEWTLFGPARNAVGFGVTLLGLGLALPLPIPGSNVVFLIPLFIYGIGLLERDGVWILLGHLGLLINVALLVAFGTLVLAALSRLVRC